MAAPGVQLCGNVCCGVVLRAPLQSLRCSKCHLVCYCCRACQTQAWKAGHKRECGQAAAARRVQGEFTDSQRELIIKMQELTAAARRVQGEFTDSQRELIIKMQELQNARNWRGLVALEAMGSAAATQLREARPGVAIAICDTLGTGCTVLGQYAKAIGLCEQALAIAEEAGYRAGKGRAYSILGCCNLKLGQYAKAITLHEQSLAIEEEMGDRASQGATCTNLGVCYERLGQYDRAIGLLDKARLILQEVGDRANECQSLGALGRCKTALGEYEQAVTFHTERWAITQELDLALAPGQTNVALELGVVIWAQARVEKGNAAAVCTTPVASSHRAAYMDSMREAAQWLRTALRLAETHGVGIEQQHARLHLSFLAIDTGEEEEALDRLKQYLQVQVHRARSWCEGCRQQRGDDAPLLTCGGCSVARFCNEDHQRMASEEGGREPVRHKDICSLLKKWRQVVKGKATAESCTPDLLAFLRKDPWWRSHAPVAADSGAGARD